MVHHGHLVLSQGARLIRADDLGAAQGLHGGEPPDDRVALGHIGDADGQHDGDHGGQPLGDGGHRQRDGHHEGADDGVQVEVARPEQAEQENKYADAQHQHAEDLAQLAQLPLQGGLALLRLGQGVGDLAHLGVHAGGADHRPAAAVDHGGAHVQHAVPVAQGDLVVGDDGVYVLLHRDALAGEGGLLGLDAGALQNAAVGGDRVARLQDHNVAGHQHVAAQQGHLAIPEHLAGGGGHLLEGLNGLFRLALLVHAQDCVDEHHDQNNEYVGEALAGVCGGDARYGGSHQQNDDHGVAQLLNKALEQGDLFPLRQLVGATFGQPVTGFLVGESGLCGPQLLQDLFWGFLVVVHGVASFPVRVEEKRPARRSGLCAGAVVVLLPPQKNSQSKENLTGGPT